MIDAFRLAGASLAILLMAACGSDSARELQYSAMPKELADCRVFYVTSANVSARDMTVVRCPLSATTTTVRAGKTTLTTVVIDGVEYAPVQPK